MIALLLAAAVQTAAPAVPTLLGAIGQQRLPARGCAAYLWNPADRQLVAMATADPATLRIAVAGKTIDLGRSGGGEAGVLGFPEAADYVGGDLHVRLSMTIVQQDGLTAGARVPQASLQVERPGQDTLVIPVAGLVGCRG